MSNDLEFAPTTANIKLDLFPATVYTGALGAKDNVYLYKEARVIVTNDYIYVIEMGPTGARFAIQEELVQFDMNKKGEFQVAGTVETYVLVRDGNCGCGSRLRGMRLLPGVGHIQREVTIE